MSVSKMLGQISGVSFPYKNKDKKFMSIYVQVQHNNVLVDLNHLDPKCTQCQLKVKRYFTNTFLMPVKPFAAAPEL
jgi:hypothetical protein